MAEENTNTTPSGIAGAMQGMQFVRGSMGQYEPVAATKPTMAPTELPEEWGGRPKGESRRAIRMREEWDKQRATQLEEQRALQAMDLQQKQFEMGLRDQQMQESDFYYNRGLKEAEQKLQAQQRSEATAIISGLNQLDPRDPDYRKKRGDIFSAYPLGVTDQGVQKIAGEYEAVNNVYQDTLNRSRERESDWLVGQQEEAATLGIDATKFFTTDPQTGAISKVDQLGLSKAIGEAKRNDLETKKSDLAQAALDKETKDKASSILDEINKVDSEIRKANFSAGREKNVTKRDEFIANSEFYRSERDVLVERFNGLLPQKPAEGAAQPQSFDSVEAAQAAKLPKGTIVVIGGRRARID